MASVAHLVMNVVRTRYLEKYCEVALNESCGFDSTYFNINIVKKIFKAPIANALSSLRQLFKKQAFNATA